MRLRRRLLSKFHLCVGYFSKSNINDSVTHFPNRVSSSKEIGADSANNYIACYPYESGEPGDLVFGAGEHITVIQKDGDWWTGIIDGTRTGIFPSNYVQPADETVASTIGAVSSPTVNLTDNDSFAAATTASVNNNNAMPSSAAVSPTAYDAGAADEAQTLEDADSEVSEINTKPMMDAVAADQQQKQELYNRPMSTTSTVSVRGLLIDLYRVVQCFFIVGCCWLDTFGGREKCTIHCDDTNSDTYLSLSDCAEPAQAKGRSCAGNCRLRGNEQRTVVADVRSTDYDSQKDGLGLVGR